MEAQKDKDTPPDMPCTHLGLADDPFSSLAYPSDSNLCHRCAPLASPSLIHQAQFCFTSKHVECPVFNQPQGKPMPRSIKLGRGKNIKQAEKSKRKKAAALGLVFVILAVLSAALFMRLFIIPSAEESPIEIASIPPSASLTPAATFTRAATAQPTSTPTVSPSASATPTLHLPFFGSPAPTEPTPTRITIPTITPLRLSRQLGVPIGAEKQFIIQRVELGESLEPYAEQFNTTLEAIISLNYYLYLKSPVTRDVLIIFPLNFSDVSGMHVLEIYQIQEKDRGINYETLAALLKTDLNDFKYYNGILTPDERPLVGQYYLIPRERLIP